MDSTAPAIAGVETRGALVAHRGALALCASLVLLLVSHPISDYDTWQHLRVGEVMWRLHELPGVNVWTWPTLGAPYDVPSWLFRVLLWPAWAALGAWGLMAWRWVTALSLVALLVVAARRASAGRGETWVAAALITWGAVFWHLRWQCRPETLVASVLASELLLLETFRRRTEALPWNRDPVWLVVPLMTLWINLHLSYTLGLVVLLAFAIDSWWRSIQARSSRAAAVRLTLAGVAATGACMINPYGWRAMWQPFHFFLTERNEAIYRVVDELQPLDWSRNAWNGLALYLALMLALALWRWRRVGFDAAQALLLAVLLPQALAVQRFILLCTVGTMPMFARDVSEFLARSAWWPRLSSARRAAWVVTPVVLLAAIEIVRVPPGFDHILDTSRLPVRACDFMAEHDVRGHGYNMFWHGGYLLWRFWPARGRLPFMDIHQTGLRTDRDLQVLSQSDTAAWGTMDRHYRFDWVLLPTHRTADQHLLEFVRADSAHWAPVVADEAAWLFLRRDGRDAALAARFGRRGAPLEGEPALAGR